MTGTVRRHRTQVPALLGIALSACSAERAGPGLRTMDLDTASVSPMSQITTPTPRAGADQINRTAPTGPIDQVSADREIDGDATPESDLVSDIAEPGPDMALYRDVALAWQAIRARGQQPSPELLAQAVGPDNLATFLSTFRNADRMFRPDADTWPVAPVPQSARPAAPPDPK